MALASRLFRAVYVPKVCLSFFVCGFFVLRAIAAVADSRFSHEGLSIEVRDEGTAVAIAIAPAAIESVQVFSLAEPNRVVIDALDRTLKTNGEFSPARNPLVQKVRLGAHPDKVRIVADIAAGRIPPTSVESRGDGVVITLPVDPELRAAFANDLKPAQMDDSETAATAAILQPGPASFQATAAAGQLLSAINFERGEAEGEAIVRLALKERPAFSFSKSDSRTYRFTISKCRLAGANLAFPFYPPDDFLGVTVVEARQSGDDTEVLVGVESGYRLAPTTSSDAILIRSAAAVPSDASPR